MRTGHYVEEDTSHSHVLSLPTLAEETPVEERVTAQEFVDALASLEARQEQSRQAFHNTVSITDALQQLDIKANAADILTEVHAQRQRVQQELQAAQQRKLRQQHKRRRMGLATVATLLCLSGYALCTLHASPVEETAPAVYIPAGVTATPAVASPGLSELRTLAEIPEGQAVQCSAQDFKALLQQSSLSLSKIIVQTPQSPTNGKWTLIKRDGHLYVEGYMAAMSAQVRTQMKTIQLYSDGLDESMAGGLAYVKPVAVRLDNFVWQGMGSKAGTSYLTLSNLQLDRYADTPSER